MAFKPVSYETSEVIRAVIQNTRPDIPDDAQEAIRYLLEVQARMHEDLWLLIIGGPEADAYRERMIAARKETLERWLREAKDE